MRPVHNRLVRQTAVLAAALAVVTCTDAGSPTLPPSASYVSPTGATFADPPQILIGAGDISSCSNNNDEATAKLLDANPDGTVINIGDDAYNNGSTSEFANCYDPTWGRHKARTKPSAGNHEYNTSGAAAGYFAYFGAAAGGQRQGLLQLRSRRLARHRAQQQRPPLGRIRPGQVAPGRPRRPPQPVHAGLLPPSVVLVDRGNRHGGRRPTAAAAGFGTTCIAAGVDLVLGGHRHFYERLAPMKPDGSRGRRATASARSSSASGGDRRRQPDQRLPDPVKSETAAPSAC